MSGQRLAPEVFIKRNENLEVANPAERLLRLIKLLDSEPHGNSFYVCLLRATNTRAGYSEVINISTYWPELAKVVLASLEQVASLEVLLREHFPGKMHLFESIFPNLQLIFGPADLNQPLNRVEDQMKAVLVPLEHAAHYLKDITLEEPISHDDLKELFDSVTALFNEINGTSLNPELKTWILKLLSKIQIAINQYQIFGSQGLKDALAEIMGELWVESEKTEEVAKAQPEGFKQRFFTLIGRLNTLISLTRNGKMLIDYAPQITAYLTDNLPN